MSLMQMPADGAGAADPAGVRAESLLTYSAYGRAAGSSRVRIFDWLDHLRIRADSFTYLNQSSNSARSLASRPLAVARAELKLRGDARRSGAGTVLLSRQASPFSNGALESRLLRGAARGVYDFDDALMSEPEGRLSAIWSKRRTWHRAVAAADVVIAGNDYLASEASRLNGNVVTIPSCVEPGNYVVKTDYVISSSPTAVWLGSPSTEQYLHSIAQPLLALHDARGLRLKLVSSGSASLGVLDRMVDREEWNSHTFGQDLSRADFGIMPLEDNPWSRGKCAYKLLQYGAAGLPMVGTPVGANKDVLRRADGLETSTVSEWADAIDSLISEPIERRAERGRAGRDAIEAEYSFSRWAGAWQEALGLVQ